MDEMGKFLDDDGNSLIENCLLLQGSGRDIVHGSAWPLPPSSLMPHPLSFSFHLSHCEAKIGGRSYRGQQDDQPAIGHFQMAPPKKPGAAC